MVIGQLCPLRGRKMDETILHIHAKYTLLKLACKTLQSKSHYNSLHFNSRILTSINFINVKKIFKNFKHILYFNFLYNLKEILFIYILCVHM